jgi:glutathione synthase/RimK-type ligase-like ATP-grasp enzyme
MEMVIAAVEAVIALPAYQEAVLAYTAPSAHYRPGPLGGLLGYDFHLRPEGPVLIEINTNAGGVLLCGEVDGELELALVEMFQDEWRLAAGGRALKTVAIVDEAPREQGLYTEFIAFQSLFQRHGLEAYVTSPEQLHYHDGRLWLEGCAIDLIYNRLTDFTLTQPTQTAMRDAYMDAAVAVTPHPHAHALYADKRNMALLSDDGMLSRLGASKEVRRILGKAIPLTELVTAKQASRFWQSRRQLYFKPAYGYGSKGVYSGEKMTRRVWETIQQGDYVAQHRVPPSCVVGPRGELKLDLRHYVYGGRSRLQAARLYRGQTTNLSTPGGGFAQVRVRDMPV